MMAWLLINLGNSTNNSSSISCCSSWCFCLVCCNIFYLTFSASDKSTSYLSFIACKFNTFSTVIYPPNSNVTKLENFCALQSCNRIIRKYLNLSRSMSIPGLNAYDNRFSFLPMLPKFLLISSYSIQLFLEKKNEITMSFHLAFKTWKKYEHSKWNFVSQN